jgi:hypothetical protein
VSQNPSAPSVWLFPLGQVIVSPSGMLAQVVSIDTVNNIYWLTEVPDIGYNWFLDKADCEIHCAIYTAAVQPTAQAAAQTQPTVPASSARPMPPSGFKFAVGDGIVDRRDGRKYEVHAVNHNPDCYILREDTPSIFRMISEMQHDCELHYHPQGSGKLPQPTSGPVGSGFKFRALDKIVDQRSSIEYDVVSTSDNPDCYILRKSIGGIVAMMRYDCELHCVPLGSYLTSAPAVAYTQLNVDDISISQKPVHSQQHVHDIKIYDSGFTREEFCDHPGCDYKKKL